MVNVGMTAWPICADDSVSHEAAGQEGEGPGGGGGRDRRPGLIFATL